MALVLLHFEMHDYFSRNEAVCSSVKHEAPENNGI